MMGPREPSGVPVSGEIGQRRRDLSIAALHDMEVAVGGDRGRVAESAHQVLGGRTGSSGQGLASMAQVMKPETWHADLVASTGERLAYSVAAHRLAVAPDEHPVSTPSAT